MSTQKSISGIIGKGSIRHNNRDFYASNVDQSRTKDNITLCKQDIHEAYHNIFDKPLAEYNAKQKRKDRRIPDYYEHIRTSKQEKLFYEVIFQIGDMKDTAVGTADAKLAAQILQEFYGKLKAENPHIHIFNAVIHMDEATPHLHIDFIPIATNSKRGLKTRNSLSKALEQQGFESEGKLNTCSRLWINSEKECLAECMSAHGWEHEVKGITRSNLSVEEFKLQERMKEVASIDEQIAERTAELSSLDKEIDSKQSELDNMADKQIAIKNLDKIPVENVMFGDKVKIERKDFYTLLNTSKKYYAYRDKKGAFKTRIAVLEVENNALKKTVSEQKEEISLLKSLREQLNIHKLQKELREIKAKLEKVMIFIDFMGLREKLEHFLNRSRKMDRSVER